MKKSWERQVGLALACQNEKFQRKPVQLYFFGWLTSMKRIQPVKRVIETRPVRGMRDRFGVDALKYNHVCAIGQSVANLYGFQPVRYKRDQFSEFNFQQV
jgi:hypothetical protein